MSIDQLTHEDALRLAVLLAGPVHAVRIDESSLTLHALTPRGEARIALNPDTRPERYLTRVREVLAGHAMGSPGGYPAHLRRWTRSGHVNPKSLDALLRLGEPEAFVAAAQSPHLTDELARRIWWAHPDAEIARAMLAHEAVRRGATAKVLAQHLLEHLPFEADPDQAIASVEAVAAAGLLDEAAQRRLWSSAQHRPHYLIGWLAGAPQTLPPAPACAVPAALSAAAADGDAFAALLVRCASAPGQGFLRALALALERPPTHDAVFRLLELSAKSFAAARDGAPAPPHAPDRWVAAARALAATGGAAVQPLLRGTTAVGPLMCRKLAPVLQPLRQHVQALCEAT